MTRLNRLVAVAALLAGCILTASGQKSELVARDEEAMRFLTVALVTPPIDPDLRTLDAHPETADVRGAGIIVGAQDAIAGRQEAGTWVLTACHVLNNIANSAADRRGKVVVKLYNGRFFYASPVGDTFREGCSGGDQINDWSVVRANVFPGGKLPFDQTGKVALNDDVYIIGHPDKDLWQISGRPGVVTGLSGPIIKYDSAGALQGTSGGPVLMNSLRLLIGMQISEGSNSVGHALDIAYLASKLTSLDIPVQIGPPLPQNPLTRVK
jgi:Trypsin-like peptidase domain